MVVPSSQSACFVKKVLFVLCLLFIPTIDGSHSCYYNSYSGVFTCNIHETTNEIDDSYVGVAIGAIVFGIIFFITCVVFTVYLIKRHNRIQQQIRTSQGNQPLPISLSSNTFLAQTNPNNGASAHEQYGGINNLPNPSAPTATACPSSPAALK